MSDSIRDTRAPGFYIIENEVIDYYGRVIGVYGLAVYNLLARYANSQGDNAFPSYDTIAQKLDISRRKAIDVVGDLVYNGLITKDERTDKAGDRTSNLYSLVTLKRGGGAGHAPQVVQDMHHGSAGHAPDQDITIKTQVKEVSAAQVEKSTPPTTPTSKKKKPANADPAEVERKARTQALLNAYVEVRGQNGIDYKVEGTWAKRIDTEGGTATEVKGCYLWLKSDPWWEFKVISMHSIFKNLDEYRRWIEKTITPVKAKEDTVIDIDWSKV